MNDKDKRIERLEGTLQIVDRHMSGNDSYEGIWVNYPDKPEQSPASVVREALADDGTDGIERHQWDRDGERCVKCGAKDWMDAPCHPPGNGARGEALEALDKLRGDSMRGSRHPKEVNRLDEIVRRHLTAPPTVPESIRILLEEISDLECHTRQGGADPMDLEELDEALHDAIYKARRALDLIAQHSEQHPDDTPNRDALEAWEVVSRLVNDPRKTTITQKEWAGYRSLLDTIHQHLTAPPTVPEALNTERMARYFIHYLPDHLKPERGSSLQPYMDALEAALEIALAQHSEPGRIPEGWRPIDTAPKGGGADLVSDPNWVEPPRILLWFPNERKMICGYWDWYYAEGGWGYKETGGCAWVGDDSCEPLVLSYGPPTHWKELPAAPAPDAEKNDD